ncbi:cell division control protein 6 homolog B [Cajanus cajan]|uniref:Cell division control protein n=1 Tax=Cajanus cajan TaxID=3821 RepID=A0A151SZC7_CAJCA|nr:cell division control protein 6 homolog B [Cajanus cajan]KYP60157.1 Cell division control protein 6 isogeny [Cajanus cajan]
MPVIAAKRTLRSHPSSPPRKSPRRCLAATPKAIRFADENQPDPAAVKPKWNPKDGEQLKMVKLALHLSTAPSSVVCREEEQSVVLGFCKGCVEHQKAGSLYLCGCPGTGKSLSMEKVKEQLLNWATEAGLPGPDVLSLNCTTLANTSDIFTKILELNQPQGKKVSATPLQQLQNMYSQKSSMKKMTLIVADELDYLITKDRAVLHDLFMLTTFPFSRCILIGVANAIDLADRFLPRLTSLNCKPIVVNFRAYTKDQILKILEERLNELPYTVFQKQALELCARKVAAASGDMRNALCICRSAIEMLEAEIRESACNLNTSLEEKSLNLATSPDFIKKREFDVVRTDHMALTLSKTYRSPVVDTIQALPHHQQIILCSSMKHFLGAKKDTNLGELYKSYVELCKSSIIPPAGFLGILEFSNMCRVLNDQGLIKLGQAREDKLRRVSPKVDEGDITFALQGIRFFQNCLK